MVKVSRAGNQESDTLSAHQGRDRAGRLLCRRAAEIAGREFIGHHRHYYYLFRAHVQPLRQVLDRGRYRPCRSR